jgi:hypothetical protein
MFRKALDANVVISKTKPFTWSYSRLKNYEACPRRYKGIDVDREWKQDETEELNEGDRLHKAMAKRIASGIDLPREFYYMEKHAERLAAITDPLQIVNCELKLAMTKEHKPAHFFDRDVWARCVVDYIKIVPKNEKYSLAHIVDYKTGKVKDDDAQLATMAVIVFACFKDIVGIKAEFLWCKYNDTRSLIFTRESILEYWKEVSGRVAQLHMAHIEDKFPPKPGFLCKEWCNIETCEYWGQGK